MAHSPPVTSLSPHFYGLLVVRYSLRFPLRTFRARLTSKAISMRSISALLAYRAVNKPMMSVILTIASLGTRVALAYLLSATPLGVTGIWLSVPIGWALADAIGIGYYLKTKTA